MRQRLQRALRQRSSLAVAAAYVVCSLAIFGHGTLRHPASEYVGWNVGSDPQGFIWALAWWPHAVFHGLNPFVTHLVDAPAGLNLAWATSVPGIALAVLPLTLVFGPVVAYNVAALLAPPLAAWTAFLLCRYLTRSWPAAAVSGAFFGFSPYVAGQLAVGHLHLTSIFLVPLAALAIIRFLRAEIPSRRLAVELGLILAGQALIATEVAFTLTLAILACLLLAYLTSATRRPRIRAMVRPLVGAYAFAAVLASPLVVYAVIGFRARSLEPPAAYPADLLNLVVPAHPTLVSLVRTRDLADSFIAGQGESGAYLGVAALAIIAAFLWRERRTGVGRLVGLALATGVLCELGTRLDVHGRAHVRLPWDLVAGAPGFTNVLPVRLSMYVSLAAAVAIALWASAPGRYRGVRLAAAAVAFLSIVPSPHRDIWTTTPLRPAFFARRMYSSCLRPNETVLMLPVPVQSYGWLWQAQAGYRFRMIDGNLVQSPPEPALFVIDISGRVSSGSASALLALARARGATTIVVTAHFAFWHRLLDPYLRPRPVGGVVLYRLDPSREGCSTAVPA